MTKEQMIGYCILALMVHGMKEPEIFGVMKILNGLTEMVTPEEMRLFHKYMQQLTEKHKFIIGVRKRIADGDTSRITNPPSE